LNFGHILYLSLTLSSFFLNINYCFFQLKTTKCKTENLMINTILLLHYFVKRNNLLLIPSFFMKSHFLSEEHLYILVKSYLLCSKSRAIHIFWMEDSSTEVITCISNRFLVNEAFFKEIILIDILIDEVWMIQESP